MEYDQRKARAFSREIIFHGKQSFIQSVCLRCGSVLRGSVSDGLPEWETEHHQTCARDMTSAREFSTAHGDRDERNKCG
jgi:transcription initiation factor TFIIIB Brf1 subunit/transcription initiation factor TFIIB